MPKMKTHSGAKKRFRVTGTGKVMHQRARHVHKFQERRASQARRLVLDKTVAGSDVRKVRKMLGL
ncbi:50S ribosomal protein L35 [Ornithinimicrobium cerasi]|jgi:large subunit ribosomal protein L35|uniref:Large ribosomal subunit protein bL35 n=1 Tax=Ornithinimicrobium cerasi TaxID=2248773 RepID=A0A285VL75_9MICO|nr:50S ribosomal protein L35 [Ornithinimicrobium cerasi]SOC54834.1 large subunit ribosomal protein L35 [Ornithinimicrobium cerasi]